MKKIYLFVLLIYNATFLTAQITISDNKVKSEEKIYLKPKPYDCSTNWEYYIDSVYKYKKYIGLKIFVPKFSEKNTYGNIYCTITNFLYKDKASKIWTSFKKECDTCPKYLNKVTFYNFYNPCNYKEKYDDYSGEFLFQLKDQENNKFYYCTYDLLKHYIIVPYFEKQQLLYKNKKLIYVYDFSKNDYDDSFCDKILYDIKNVVTSENENGEIITTPKEVKLKRGSKWSCIDVTLIKTSEIYTKQYLKELNKSYDPEYFEYKLFYILKNDIGETIGVEKLKPLRVEEKENNSNCRRIPEFDEPQDGFVLESVYIEKARQEKMKAQTILAKQKEDEKSAKLKAKIEYEKTQKILNSKYGTKYGKLIIENKICIGMDKEMCETSWGTPFYKDKRITAEKSYEIWYYFYGFMLYFNNNELIQINE